MATETEYDTRNLPDLQSVLDRFRAQGLTAKVRIRSGCPRHWFSHKYLRHVHANLSMRSGREAMRSKSLTDEILAMPVARYRHDEEHKAITILVFQEYGRMKVRPKKSVEPEPGAPGGNIVLPPGTDGELPF